MRTHLPVPVRMRTTSSAQDLAILGQAQPEVLS